MPEAPALKEAAEKEKDKVPNSTEKFNLTFFAKEDITMKDYSSRF